ncbi:MAG: hypothetical protein IT362_06090 [Deltaproteobacteria bacterium]|nr:hypothetical protein [Deltaproteobacteria bacterium]
MRKVVYCGLMVEKHLCEKTVRSAGPSYLATAIIIVTTTARWAITSNTFKVIFFIFSSLRSVPGLGHAQLIVSKDQQTALKKAQCFLHAEQNQPGQPE